MDKKYTIFISFKNSDEMGKKTKDSELAEKCYRYLTNKGIDTFFSNIELTFIGKAQYSEVIDGALDSARFLIAVGCSHDNLNSRWVRYEWESFINDIRSGIKPEAEVFVLYQDMAISELPRALRQQQAFNADDNESFEKLYGFILSILSRDAKKAEPKPPVEHNKTIESPKTDEESHIEDVAIITPPRPHMQPTIRNPKPYSKPLRQTKRGEVLRKEKLNNFRNPPRYYDDDHNDYDDNYDSEYHDDGYCDNLVDPNLVDQKTKPLVTGYDDQAPAIMSFRQKIFYNAPRIKKTFLIASATCLVVIFTIFFVLNRIPRREPLVPLVEQPFNEVSYFNGGTFRGDWVDGLPHGMGRIYWQNGDYFIGEWVWGEIENGSGIMHLPNGDWFSGEWIDGRKNGWGEIRWSNGDWFEGYWSNSQKNGWGNMVWSDGTYYNGSWANSLRHGEGRTEWANGDVLSGEWEQDDFMNGWGRFTFENGDIYSGNWANYQLHGQGVMVFAEGIYHRLNGHWEYNQMHGFGWVLDVDWGIHLEGMWYRDILLKPAIHIVRQGENLQMIARQNYSTLYVADAMRLIAEANGITNQNIIQVGQVLILPEIDMSSLTVASRHEHLITGIIASRYPSGYHSTEPHFRITWEAGTELLPVAPDARIMLDGIYSPYWFLYTGMPVLVLMDFQRQIVSLRAWSQ